MSPAHAKVWTGAQWSERIAPLVDFPDDGPPPWLLPGGLPGDVREQDVPSLRQGADWSSMERQDWAYPCGTPPRCRPPPPRWQRQAWPQTCGNLAVECTSPLPLQLDQRPAAAERISSTQHFSTSDVLLPQDVCNCKVISSYKFPQLNFRGPA